MPWDISGLLFADSNSQGRRQAPHGTTRKLEEGLPHQPRCLLPSQGPLPVREPAMSLLSPYPDSLVKYQVYILRANYSTFKWRNFRESYYCKIL